MPLPKMPEPEIAEANLGKDHDGFQITGAAFSKRNMIEYAQAVREEALKSPRSPGGSAAKLDGPHNGATMDTHELAEKLLEGPRRELTASVDLSSGDDDHGRRAFGDLVGLQYEADGETATLFFEDGYINE